VPGSVGKAKGEGRAPGKKDLQFKRMTQRSPLRRLVATLALGALLLVRGDAARGVGVASATGGGQAAGTFAAQVAALSEPAGYFDTDNLISNERSYLQVLPDLERRNIRGGAYIGVGPDQNFSYIAHIRPDIAFIVDIRRDNLLLHLLFKALFAESPTRVEYLARLFGRPVPPGVDGWRDASIERLAAHIDGGAPERHSTDVLRARVDAVIKGFGVPLSPEDFATIDRFHRRFIDAGPGLRFESLGRPPQSYYPTYRQLLLETDSDGRQRNYLASEEAFQFVKSLEARDRVIPVVGNLGGPSALTAIGRALAQRGEQLTAFYTSNVEFYLQREGTYATFVSNLTRIPHTNRSVIIRAIFGRGSGSFSVVQPVDELVSELNVPKF
jgi:hypothetical protein